MNDSKRPTADTIDIAVTTSSDPYSEFATNGPVRRTHRLVFPDPLPADAAFVVAVVLRGDKRPCAVGLRIAEQLLRAPEHGESPSVGAFMWMELHRATAYAIAQADGGDAAPAPADGDDGAGS